MTEAIATKPPRKLRIVLLDDERYMLMLLEAYLKEWFDNVELHQFRHGDDAWRELEQTPPDLFITDWQHPGLDGGALLRKLAEQHTKTPVLLLTALEYECIEEFAKSGLKIVFLQKPFGVAEFWKVINHLVGPCDHPPAPL